MSSASTMEYADSTMEENPRPRLLPWARIAAAGLFLLTLVVPLFGAAMNWDPVASQENRILARPPGVPRTLKDFTHFSDVFLDYYRDHFGFRNTLIRALSLVRFKGGLSQDQNTNIIIGKDGWLFYPSNSPNVLADRNLDPFTSGELDQWQHLLEQRNRFCQEHGIAFVAVIPPDKQSIYTEYLPPDLSLLGPKSRLDQIVERLRQTHSPVRVIDLRPTLLEAKKYHRVYFKTDTHWNDYGGFAAYPVILNAVNEALPWAKLTPQPASDFIPRSTIHSGDLARYLNLYYEYNEDWLQMIRRDPYPPIVTPDNPYTPVTTAGPNPNAPALYMMHDSFTLYLGQFLGPNFSRVCWRWTTVMYGNEILKFKPSVVIDEFLERTMYLPAPQDPSEVASATGP